MTEERIEFEIEFMNFPTSGIYEVTVHATTRDIPELAAKGIASQYEQRYARNVHVARLFQLTDVAEAIRAELGALGWVERLPGAIVDAEFAEVPDCGPRGGAR